MIWRSVRNAPPIESFLDELIQRLANQQDLNLPATIDNKLSMLMHLLQQHRCLIVLDNFEALESLERRSLIERHSPGFMLKPMLMSFMKERLNDQAEEEDICESLKTSLKMLSKTNVAFVRSP